ncbi:hypothetical protein HS088_TW08G00354 [Tripterygium wilfordii]|uniref:DUF7806 domain-containing protein n=1 Tax=Tripterygium wilfordii TaxID=458696 RepID=A0A7J7DBP7_TRIWF|nr:uncharacterized protein LOC120003441 [Tripterygium wilfordii]KAF5743767.1 hypothetical protein HS088_TW08G00354 [Tripterygium wilfordii]
MEALYKKLYDKYSKLKTKKIFELDELNKEQEVKFLNYVSAAEELIHHLRSENDRLRVQVNELRNETASIRSTKDGQCAEYQKLLLEENQKNKTLSEEVERLQRLNQEGLSSSSKSANTDNVQLNTTHGTQVVSGKASIGSSRRMTKKRIRESGVETDLPNGPSKRMTRSQSHEPGAVSDGVDDAIVRDTVEDLSEKTVFSGALAYDQLPECCKRIANGSGGDINEQGPANCLFQAFVEYLLGMKLSAKSQSEGISISVVHQSSGYSFSLTWVNKAAGGECELLYRVLSLGTFERVAPEWMREMLRFSTSMCPIFFERVARVIKLQC